MSFTAGGSHFQLSRQIPCQSAHQFRKKVVKWTDKQRASITSNETILIRFGLTQSLKTKWIDLRRQIRNMSLFGIRDRNEGKPWHIAFSLHHSLFISFIIASVDNVVLILGFPLSSAFQIKSLSHWFPPIVEYRIAYCRHNFKTSSRRAGLW